MKPKMVECEDCGRTGYSDKVWRGNNLPIPGPVCPICQGRAWVPADRPVPFLSAFFAQVFLAWALKLDGRDVMKTVYDGIDRASRAVGKTPQDWRAAVSARDRKKVP